MARSVSRDAIVLRAQQLADMVGYDFVEAAEWASLANVHFPEVYDLLVDCGPPDYYGASATINVVAGTLAYALPADFRTMSGLFVNDSTTRRRMLTALEDRERAAYQPAQVSGTLTLEYVPAPPLLAAGADTFDGVSGWDELVALLMARSALDKQEQDSSAIVLRINEMRARIRSSGANRDRGGPRFISDLDAPTLDWWWQATSLPVTRYRLRAGNVEVYSPIVGPP